MSGYRNRSWRWLAALTLVLSVGIATAGLAGASAASQPVASAPAQGAPVEKLSANATVFATGLNNPRGLKFGPDGNLCVAEGGPGGKDSTVGKCVQVVAPVGPYTGSPTGSRISRIDSKGVRTTFAEGFPSSNTTPETGGFISGVADIAFINNTLYAVTAGGGCSHGVAGTTNGVFRVDANGKATQIADLTQFQKTHPVAVPNPADFEPDGTWYSLTAVNGNLYAIEPNHGELDSITPDGIVTRLADISDSQGHIVPTAMAYHDGSFYVGNLGDFPAEQHSKILRVDQYGNVHFVADELTTVLGVAFDKAGDLYALQTSAPITSTEPGPPVIPGTGSVVKFNKTTGEWHPVATGLMVPSAMTFGPDGFLYISDFGFGVPPTGLGQIVRVDVTKAP
jgi:hypothetical protein